MDCPPPPCPPSGCRPRRPHQYCPSSCPASCAPECRPSSNHKAPPCPPKCPEHRAPCPSPCSAPCAHECRPPCCSKAPPCPSKYPKSGAPPCPPQWNPPPKSLSESRDINKYVIEAIQYHKCGNGSTLEEIKMYIQKIHFVRINDNEFNCAVKFALNTGIKWGYIRRRNDGTYYLTCRSSGSSGCYAQCIPTRIFPPKCPPKQCPTLLKKKPPTRYPKW